ncbi:hypothetical protein KDU71_07555 [Carboxylicivirga sediminis]|uniref:Uncharacterized protein n=1 Tax=Carboxylicivirga sediminis TaxID=2006564 RepID=A0A941F307_9BACT|nr:hypothetical protein [Carboxylicivirga sediminis]MBR8535412.1 hypothetical protein [Carboxylicivirga sediminis]
MKITQGYTLSQFVDIMKADGWKESDLIYRYNEFLKQPLTKEMFVNNKKCPIAPCENYQVKVKQFREAEKKVIFEDVRIEPYTHHSPIKDLFVNNKFIARTDSLGNWNFNCTTLGDLFEATKGELTLKNVEV